MYSISICQNFPLHYYNPYLFLTFHIAIQTKAVPLVAVLTVPLLQEWVLSFHLCGCYVCLSSNASNAYIRMSHIQI